jgi:hypothetical protein
MTRHLERISPSLVAPQILRRNGAKTKVIIVVEGHLYLLKGPTT